MFYDCDIQPRYHANNPKSCLKHEEFISRTLIEWLCDGSLSLWGKVGNVDPPHLVMPLVVEETKPRLCHNEKFLNLWCKDCPFSLDSLANIPPILSRGTYMATCDERSAYNGVLLSENSQTFFGLQWHGWYMVYRLLAFGWKENAYTYQCIGSVPTTIILHKRMGYSSHSVFR